MKMKTILIGMIALGAAAFTTLQLRHRDASRPPVASNDEEAPKSDEVAALRREVTALKQLTLAKALQPPPTSPPAAAPARPRRPPVDPVEQKRVLTDVLEARFGGETPDPSWSAQRVETIKTSLATSVPGVNVLAASCASTLCRVTLEHTNDESQGTLMEKVSEVQGLNAETYFLFDKDSTPPRTTFYMARAGHSLPRPQI